MTLAVLLKLSPLTVGLFVGSGLFLAVLFHILYTETHPDQRERIFGPIRYKGMIALIAVVLVVLMAATGIFRSFGI